MNRKKPITISAVKRMVFDTLREIIEAELKIADYDGRKVMKRLAQYQYDEDFDSLVRLNLFIRGYEDKSTFRYRKHKVDEKGLYT